MPLGRQPPQVTLAPLFAHEPINVNSRRDNLNLKYAISQLALLSRNSPASLQDRDYLIHGRPIC
jgi:hypothetical protein